MVQPKEYYAFISYKREDEKWAKWLQHKLEHYHLPTNVRKENPSLPQNIRPVFKDTSELAAGVLADEIHDALDNSKFLIVICSPRAAQSVWVGKEVQTFIDMGRADKIIPFVIGGQPFSDKLEEECFPSALLNLPKEQELLGVNINEMGRDAAVVKVVARMFGLKFDTLWQRYQREQRKKRFLVYGSVLLFALASLAIGGYIWHQSQEIKEKNWKMMENQARAVAEKANQLISEGDSYTAIRILAEVLPKDWDNPDRPFLPEVEIALRRAWYSNYAVLKGHTDAVVSVVRSSDQQMILTASEDGTAKIWDAQTGCLLHSFPNHARLHSAFFSPSNKKVITRTWDGEVKVWNVETERRVMTLPFEGLRFASFYQDDNHLLIVDSDLVLYVYDIGNQPHRRIRSYSLKCDDNGSAILSISDNGKDIATLHRGNQIVILNFETGEERVLVGHQKNVKSLRFGKNGRSLYSCSADGTIRIWRTKDGSCQKIISLGDSSVVDFDVWNDELIASIASSKLKIIQVDNGEEVFSYIIPDLGIFESCESICWNEDGNELAVSFSNGRVRLYNFVNPLFLGPVDISGITLGKFGPDGSELALVKDDTIIAIYDGESIIKSWSSHTKEIVALQYSSDGRFLMSASQDGFVTIWNRSNYEKEKTYKIGNSKVSDALYCPKGDLMASLSDDGVVGFWKASTGQYLGRLPSDDIGCMAFNGNGDKMVTCSSGGSIKIWDVEKRRIQDSIGSHSLVMQKIAFSPDGKYIVSSGLEGMIKIWDTDTKQSLYTCEGHKNHVNSICFHPDSKYFISTSLDKSIIWSLESGKQVGTLENFAEYNDYEAMGALCALFNPVWNVVMTISLSNEVHLWAFPSTRELVEVTEEFCKNRPLTPDERRKYYLE